MIAFQPTPMTRTGIRPSTPARRTCMTFENRLVQRGGVKIVYDGDGNRVQETVAGITTSYLVADQNPTGYAQVLDELQGGAVVRTYSYGLELINERQTLAGTLTTSFYGFDGHGSVRFLTDSTGAITDTYDYDAFGNVIFQTGSTPNNYLFAGEQFDPALGIYYNRARYYDQRQGRFWTMDIFEGHEGEPGSLHKFLYTYADPVDHTDACGMCLASTGQIGNIVQEEVFKDFLKQYPGGSTNVTISKILGLTVSQPLGGLLAPDLIDPGQECGGWGTVGQIYEIKSVYSIPLAEFKVDLYVSILNAFDKKRTWIAGISYFPEKTVIDLPNGQFAILGRPAPGVVSYCVVDVREVSLIVTAALAGITVELGAAA